jgi:DNA adenine methylase
MSRAATTEVRSSSERRKPTDAFGECTPARLFRWPGSKWHLCQRLTPTLETHLAATGGRLLSLFLGTGALEQSVGALRLIAADANPDLRTVYSELIRDGGAETFHELVVLDHAGALRTRAQFERVRAIDPRSLRNPARAARFLWLSGLTFNGIWRVNRGGVLNVPPDPRRLAHAWPFPVRSELTSVTYQLPYLSLFEDWRHVIQQARPGDLVLSDPPYLSGFDAYTAARFSLAEHHALAESLHACSKRGVAVVAFNSIDAHPLYRGWSRVETVSRPGRMNCRASRRGPVGEMLATTGLHSTEEQSA